jgi:Phosphotransferase enzyme family
MEKTATAEAVWAWPFTISDLTAGLRRHVGDVSLRIDSVASQPVRFQRPSIGRVRGLCVDYHADDKADSCSLVVKEPQGITRAGLAGAGRREVGVYRALAPELPLATPRLVAASATGSWMVFDALRPVRDAAAWRPEDYWTALDGLVRLHDRFWGLGEDLAAFPWLGRPLEGDFEVHVTAAAMAIQHIVETGKPASLASIPDRMSMLAELTTRADEIIAPLRDEPVTLLHGDYWPGNIASVRGGRQVVFDWQLAGIGPAVMDLLAFVTKSEWWFGELPVARTAIVDYYREGVSSRSGISWDEATWDRLWDHALMWRFLQEWVDLLAASPEPVLAARTELLEQVWLEPVARAVARRLGKERQG